MHPALPVTTHQKPDLGQHVLIEQEHSGTWHAVLYNRVRRRESGLLSLDLNPVTEWRTEKLSELVEAVEAAAPGVGMLVLVEG